VKLSLDPAGEPRTVTPESLALAAWYDTHPTVRRMWAIKDAETLRVIVTLEPTVDSDDTLPAWLAQSQAWVRELQLHTGYLVELELIEDPLSDEIESDVEGDIVIVMYWRDPALSLIQ